MTDFPPLPEPVGYVRCYSDGDIADPQFTQIGPHDFTEENKGELPRNQMISRPVIFLDQLHAYTAALQSRVAALEAECEGLRRDAERYRWLRDNADDSWEVREWLDGDSQALHYGDYLDAAIDAARGK